MAEPRPFTVHVPDDVLTDLRGRLARSRIPEDSPRRPPSGMTAGYLRELVGTWIDWDWRAREAWLNRHPQYVVPVDGTDLHYVHAPALLVMHGWPHTFALQLDFADLLPDMHVVVASLPGFGFSTPYPDGPMTEKRLASTVHALMSDVLGHDRYLTYGEDVTANVSDLVAGIVATHAHFPTIEERAQLTDPEARAFFDGIAATHRTDGAYGHVQATRPDTLAAALDDSPAGRLAWLTEKLVEWSDTPTSRSRSRRRRSRPPSSSSGTRPATPSSSRAATTSISACSTASPRAVTSRSPKRRGRWRRGRWRRVCGRSPGRSTGRDARARSGHRLQPDHRELAVGVRLVLLGVGPVLGPDAVEALSLGRRPAHHRGPRLQGLVADLDGHHLGPLLDVGHPDRVLGRAAHGPDDWTRRRGRRRRPWRRRAA
ncbi:MAG TPA: epoxide hydrolase N-terminal domain-containing protein [Promicromonospora sp.]|nr:epoxide hydrolase N-terminal domain-containing protein [Promicromonospora sp.]